MGSITLHKKYGVNPRITICPRCGVDQGIALMGIANYKDVCLDCGMVHFGGANKPKTYNGIRTCAKCDSSNLQRVEMKEHEKVAGEVCEACKKEMDTYKQVMEDGGVAFKCAKCKSQGVIKENHPLCKKVREKHTEINKEGLDFTVKQANGRYLECGIELEDCPNCQKKEGTTDG